VQERAPRTRPCRAHWALSTAWAWEKIIAYLGRTFSPINHSRCSASDVCATFTDEQNLGEASDANPSPHFPFHSLTDAHTSLSCDLADRWAMVTRGMRGWRWLPRRRHGPSRRHAHPSLGQRATTKQLHIDARSLTALTCDAAATAAWVRSHINYGKLRRPCRILSAHGEWWHKFYPHSVATTDGVHLLLQGE
jgi:hypothetical protein